MYVGDINQVNKLVKWLNDYYHSKQNDTPKFVILHGPTGNGKTLLVYKLAERFKVDVYRITSEDVSTKQTLSDTLQRINLCSIDGNQTKKIVLIDDIQDFSNHTYIKILDISMHPVMITSDKYLSPNITENIKHKFFQLEIKKPLPSQIFKIIKTVQQEQKIGINLTDQQLETIARESKSARGAINALYTGQIQHLTPQPSILDIRRQLPKRELTKDIDIPLMVSLTKTQHCYDTDTLDVYNRFCEFDFCLRGKFYQKIDKEIVNLIPEPIEQIKWIKQEKKKQKKFKSKKEEPPKQSIKPVNTLDKYMDEASYDW